MNPRQIIITSISISVSIFLTGITHLFAFDKYAGEFLKYGSSVREMSLGGAMLAAPSPVAAPYWNAAALANNQRLSAQLMHSEEFAGILKFDQLAVVIPNRQRNSYGLSYFRLSVDDIPDTRRALLDLGSDGLGPGDENYPGPDPDGTEGNGRLDPGERLDMGKVGSFGASQSALLLATSRRLSDRLVIGLTWKQIFESLYVDHAYGLGFDLAAIYQLNRHLTAAVTLNDFTSTFIFWQNGRPEVVAPSLRLGTLFSGKLGHKIDLSLGLAADCLFEGKLAASVVQLGNFAAVRARAGVELIYYRLLALRTGRDDLGAWQVGLGIQTEIANLDYGFAFGSSYATLGNSHRLALTFHLKELFQALRQHI